MKDRNDNKLVAITGATGGIGRVIAKSFLENNYKVLLVGRSGNKLELLKKELSKISNECFSLKIDISKKEQVENILKKEMEKIGKIDVLINAAAIQGPIGKIETNDIEHWEKTIKTNLLGTWLCSRTVIPQMLKQKKGVIINFSGGGALGIRENFSAYAVAKAGVVRLTEIMAEEVRDKNIRINAIAPGAINTDMFDEMLDAGEIKVGKNEWRKLMEQKKKGGQDPLMAANLCLWLASGKSKPLTGKTISAIYDDWQKWDRIKINSLANQT